MRDLSQAEIRAARLTRLPGVSLAEACELTGARPAGVNRARRMLGLAAHPSRHDLALAALTHSGKLSEGPMQSPVAIASFIDGHHHDGTTPEDAKKLLDELVERKAIAIEGERFRLLQEWPSGHVTPAQG